MRFYLSSEVETPFSKSLLSFMESSDIENGINRLMEFFGQYGVTLGLGRYTITYSGKDAVIGGAGLREELLLRGFNCVNVTNRDVALRDKIAYFWDGYKLNSVSVANHSFDNKYYILDSEVLDSVSEILLLYKEKVIDEIQAV